MYADDTILLVSDCNIDTISTKLGIEVANCYHWLTNNCLSMHMGKTEAVVLSSKRKKHLIKNFVIKCQGYDIKPSDTVKYLGLHIDQFLSGELTVNSIVSKCTLRLKFMFRYSKALNEKSRKLLASAIIQCYFDYASSAWYPSLTNVLKQKLKVAQNKVVRFILDMGPRTHIGQDELDKVGILNTGDRVQQLMTNHMFTVYNGLAPKYFQDHFTRRNDQSQHYTRSSEFNFVLPRVNGCAKDNFCYQGVKIWNELHSTIKCISNKQSFKTNVKRFLRNRALDMEHNDFVYY